jgi:hypothetical protein
MAQPIRNFSLPEEGPSRADAGEGAGDSKPRS